MSLQGWSETLITAQVDGTAYVSSTTPTSIIPGAAKLTLTPNFYVIGKTLRVTAQGRISTTTGPPTITLDVRHTGTVVWNGAAVTTVASVTNKTWELVVELTCRSIGAAATLMGVGRLTSSAVVGASGGAASSAMLPDSAPAVGSSFDSTSAQVLDLFATWSANSASNSLALHNYIVESLN